MGIVQSAIGNLLPSIKNQKIDAPHIKVASLNYSGLLNSPFEYFSSNENVEEQVSKQMERRTTEFGKQKKIEGSFSWKLGKIDKQFQKGRFSPIYMSKCGTAFGQALTKQQFRILWEYQAKKVKGLVYTEEEKNNAIQFDYMCFESIFTVAGNDVQKYKKLMEQFFSRSYLKEKLKINQVTKTLEFRDAQIIFLQETTQKLLQSLATLDYEILRPRKGNSAIMIKKNVFRLLNTQQELKKIGKCDEDLNWNQDTCYGFVDNLIVLSIHLSSKKDKNEHQTNEMLKKIIELKKAFPQKDIIVGGDANCFVKERFDKLQIEEKKQLNLFPTKKEEYTCKKKRTFLQVQTSKANVESTEVKDNIITTLPIIRSSVQTIYGLQSKNFGFIPTSRHPFDHFLVASLIQYQPKKQSS